MAKIIRIGKNKYSLPEREFTSKEGKQTVYRFYYPSNDKLLANVIAIVEQSYTRELTEIEYSFLVSCVWIVEHHNTEKSKSKLDGIKSISTCCLDNDFCLFRMNDCNSICHDCYAGTQQERQHGLQEHNIVNGIILRNVAIPAKYWKQLALFNESFARIESFGDVANETQTENYIEIMRAFENTTFAAWTKNVVIWFNALEKAGKPENMVFVVSSCHKNVVINLAEKYAKYVDHVFTVYEKECIIKNNIGINCGGRACKECIAAKKNCYFRNTEYHIREELK